MREHILHVCNELLAKCAAEQAVLSTSSQADAGVAATAAPEAAEPADVAPPTTDAASGTVQTETPAAEKSANGQAPPASVESEGDRPKGSALLRVYEVMRTLHASSSTVHYRAVADYRSHAYQKTSR